MSIVLRDYQQRFGDYLDAGGKRAVLVAHRRAGKDLAGLYQTYRAASLKVGTYWYLLPTYSQAKKVVWLARFGGLRLLDVTFPRESRPPDIGPAQVVRFGRSAMA
jgi:phage terminase large subunit